MFYILDLSFLLLSAIEFLRIALYKLNLLLLLLLLLVTLVKLVA